LAPGGVLEEAHFARLPLVLRWAHAFAKTLDMLPIEIAEDELIAGKTARGGVILHTSLPEFATGAEKEQAQREGQGITSYLSHKVPDYPDLPQRGLGGILAAFITLGGNMLTVTVVDAEQLRRAMEQPEKYRGLRVRMGGWTAYFVALSREQQLLQIRRVEHGL
jgi:hypothetical protein